MPHKKDDSYTKAGATALVERIESYWRQRGYHGIAVSKYQDPNFGSGTWFIRSNIGPLGYPPCQIGLLGEC